jgi:hypothetical protein
MPLTSITECLSHLPTPWSGTIVVLGAGNGDLLEALAALQPARLVLVEGDPDALAELRRRARRMRSAEVLGEVVSAQGGSLQWHRYSLAPLNGPLDAAVLKPFYPRLKALDSVPVDSVPLASLLRQLNLDEAAPAMLLIDLPGQEGPLLQSLPDSLLNRFGQVLLRGCSVVLGEGLVADVAVAALQQRCFEPTATSDAEPLWPVSLLRHDAVAYADRQRQKMLADLQQQLRERDAALAALTAEQTRRDEAAALERNRLASEVETLTQAKAQLAAEREAQRSQLETALQTAKTTGETANRLLMQCELQLDLASERIKQLQTQLAEQQQRQEQVDQEMAHAEGQLELARRLLMLDMQR